MGVVSCWGRIHTAAFSYCRKGRGLGGTGVNVICLNRCMCVSERGNERGESGEREGENEKVIRIAFVKGGARADQRADKKK